MRQHKLQSTGLFLLVLISAYPALAIDQQVNTGGKLKPETVQEIQGISQNLLTAKHSETPAPELQQLRQQVKNLRTAVEKLTSTIDTTATVSTLTIAESAVSSETKSLATRQDERSRYAKLEQDIHTALDGVRQQRTKIEHKEMPEQHRKHAHNVAAKVKELEDELEQAMKSQPEEQTKKLKELQHRLAITNRHEQIAKEPVVPTISSIVRHRE